MNYPEILKGRVATYKCSGTIYSKGVYHLRWVWIDTTWSSLEAESDWFGFETLEECIEDHRVHVEKLHAIRYGETISQSLPVPAGEVGELVARLRRASDGASAMGWEQDSWIIARAAALLEQRHAAPVPVAVVNRLPGSEDCDTQGRCWMGYEDVHVNGLNQSCKTWFWTLEHFSMLDEYSHWLPYSSISLPTSELG